MRNFGVAAAAVAGIVMLAGAASPAFANCPHTSVKDVRSYCLDKRCPEGLQGYFATITNRFPHTLYITYAFRAGDRNTSIIPGGLELKPNSSVRKPLGIGYRPLPKGEEIDARAGRLRILECGTDPDIRYKWRLK